MATLEADLTHLVAKSVHSLAWLDLLPYLTPPCLMNGLGASIDHERHQQKCAAASLSSINTRRTGFKLYFTIWVVLFVLKAVIRSEWVWIACDAWCYEVGVGTRCRVATLPSANWPTSLPQGYSIGVHHHFKVRSLLPDQSSSFQSLSQL